MTKFLAFDTEGLDINGDHQTILISNSEGDYLFNRKGLKFEELFDFIIKPTDKTRVWFAFGYDVNMIFKNISREDQIDLFKNNECVINDYKVKYFPKKILKIHKNNVSHKQNYKINHYDVFGFFQKSFIESLKDWKMTIPSLIQRGKLERIDFNLWNNANIIEYNALECKLLTNLMDKLDSKLSQNSIFLEHYHGAGAIASYLLAQIKADKYKLCANPIIVDKNVCLNK